MKIQERTTVDEAFHEMRLILSEVQGLAMALVVLRDKCQRYLVKCETERIRSKNPKVWQDLKDMVDSPDSVLVNILRQIQFPVLPDRDEILDAEQPPLE